VEILFHPKVLDTLTTIAEEDFDVYEDVLMLINALQDHGRSITNVDTDECHAVRSSPRLYALRRTPPSATLPHAMRPPVVRILFAFVHDADLNESAIVLHLGDKTSRGNDWYPAAISTAEKRLFAFTATTNSTAPNQRDPRRTSRRIT
jgi:hypothetical protein